MKSPKVVQVFGSGYKFPKPRDVEETVGKLLNAKSENPVKSEIHKQWDDAKKLWEEGNPGQKGMKFSADKPKWQYMAPLWPAMEEVVKVLTRGAEKYEINNWMHVSPDSGEYIRAIMSHYTAYVNGETFDPDMGSHHLANLICSCLFLMWHDGIRSEDEERV